MRLLNRVILLVICVSAGSLSAAVTSAAQSSGVDTTGFDRSVRPGDDFYRFVNGRWIERSEIPPYLSGWGAGSESQVRAFAEMRDILSSPMSGRDARDPDRRKLADLYQSYIDERAIESAGITPLQAELARISAIKSTVDVAATLAHFARLGISSPIAISVHPDDRDPTRNMADVEQSGLTLPDRDYYLSAAPRFTDTRTAYRDHIERVLALSGDRAAAENATAIIAFETKLAAAQWTSVENRDPVKTYNRVELTALETSAPGLHWNRLAADLGLSGRAAHVNISEPTYFKELGRLVQETPPAVWSAYFRWSLVSHFSAFLAKPFDDERIAFSQTMSGVTVSRPRWMRAVGFVDDRMGNALGRLYSERYFPQESRARVETLVRSLLAAFRSRLQALDWMSLATRREAEAKLTALTVKLGNPTRRQDYGALRTSPHDLVGNVIRARSFKYDLDLDRLGKPIDREEWGMSPLTVNGSYSALRNEIVLPAALMQPPYFQSTADDAVNYGGLGWFIAHELSHAFDNRGNQYDSHGNLRDWWTADDHERFAARTAALIEQYSHYEPVPGMFINGALTVGENIADNLGLAIAYEAYHQSLGTRIAPVLDGLTGDQRFYVAFARVWASKSREASVIQGLKSDTHSPANFRVLGALVNQDPFYAAFDVQQSDSMYVPPSRRVRIW
jgi:putative endopeptidase